jgi:hypothetical protein
MTDERETGIGDVRQATLMEIAVRLLGIIAVRDFPQMRQIAILSRVGFSPKEIGEVIGTTANTVRVALVSIRKAEKHGKRAGLRRKDEGEDAKS